MWPTIASTVCRSLLCFVEVVEGAEGRPRHLALQPRDLGPELFLDGPPLELECGGEEAGLGGPHLAHQAHAAGDLKLLQPGGSQNSFRGMENDICPHPCFCP